MMTEYPQDYYGSSPSLQPARWAGGAYENSPNPELLPLPSWKRGPGAYRPAGLTPFLAEPSQPQPLVYEPQPPPSDVFFDAFDNPPVQQQSRGRGGKNGRGKANTVNGGDRTGHRIVKRKNQQYADAQF